MPARGRITSAASALADLEEILSRYAGEGVPAVGTRIVEEILQRIEALGALADLGRVVPEFGRDNLRELIQPPFRVVYRRDRGRIRVVRVWRSERLLRLPP